MTYRRFRRATWRQVLIALAVLAVVIAAVSGAWWLRVRGWW